jgi:uncharacterized protein RhaS with RHS repeats
LDGSTGLYYFNARYYAPAIGRFITSDPIKDGLNWYVYCKNNPLRYVDPNGLTTWELTLGWHDFAQSFPAADGPIIAGDAVYVLGIAVTAVCDILSSIGPQIVAAIDEGVYLAEEFADKISNEIEQNMNSDGNTPNDDNNNKGNKKSYTEGQYKQFQKQLKQHGEESLLKSRQTFQNRITEHLQKVDEAQKNGGYTSSMLREIDNWEQQINAIDAILGDL